MIEAVGHEHLISYFATINAAVKPGGKAVIQVRGAPCFEAGCALYQTVCYVVIS
jgi:cyclopropane fatty-acyl-phospholipid synthase-like methyltransferase